MEDLLFTKLPETLVKRDWGVGPQVCKDSCVTEARSLSCLLGSDTPKKNSVVATFDQVFLIFDPSQLDLAKVKR